MASLAERYLRALLKRPLRDNIHRLRYRATCIGRAIASRARVAAGRGFPADKRLARAFRPGHDSARVGSRARAGTGPRFFVHPSQRRALVSLISRVQPEAPLLAVRDAERILSHQFDLLGSGPADLGVDIDWHRDFKTGYGWPPDGHYGGIDGRYLIPDSDVKVPWELSRGQFLPTLGRAYWYTGDERYPAEYVRLVDHWLAHNRPEAGVNWACAMDVSIRAVNWLWGYFLLADSPRLTAAFEERLFAGLLEHGRFLMRNLEGAPGEMNSNHYLSDVAGLLHLGLLLPEFAESVEWLETGERAIIREMDQQVLDDGADWEMSTSYHRLVAEIFLTCAILLRRNGRMLPDPFLERLALMIDYTFHYTRPDGTVPIIGDADNGRLQRLTSWEEPGREFTDHRHLLAAGAVLFRRPEWTLAAGACWEEACWLLGEEAAPTAALRTRAGYETRAGSRAYEHVGNYVMRAHSLYSIARIGNEGFRAPSGHRHNDQLSFEIFADGPFVIDPGSFVYTAEPAARNAFRSSLSHNGVVVDGQEAIPFDPNDLFSMPSQSSPSVERWESNDEWDLLVAHHSGYMNLPDPVLVRRSWLFDKTMQLWIIWDRLEAAETHSFGTSLQFAPDVTLHPGDQGPLLLRAKSAMGQQLAVFRLGGAPCRATLDAGWASLGYGTRVRAPRATLAFSEPGTADLVWALVPVVAGPASRSGRGSRSPLDSARSSARTFARLDAKLPLDRT